MRARETRLSTQSLSKLKCYAHSYLYSKVQKTFFSYNFPTFFFTCSFSHMELLLLWWSYWTFIMIELTYSISKVHKTLSSTNFITFLYLAHFHTLCIGLWWLWLTLNVVIYVGQRLGSFFACGPHVKLKIYLQISLS